MASNTKTLTDSMNWAMWFVGNRSFAPNSPTSLEPALTSGNIIQQTMLQPPFSWRWNRATATFNTALNTSSYVVNLPQFGFIEKASVVDGSGSTFEIPNITTKILTDKSVDRPTTICPALDDNNGNITFQFLPGLQDQVYIDNLLYQKKPVLFTNLTTAWTIPDEYGYVYDWGFLALFLLFANTGDNRAFAANQKFVANLLALQEGLTEQQKAIFLGEWDFLLRAISSQTNQQLGLTGRQS